MLRTLQRPIALILLSGAEFRVGWGLYGEFLCAWVHSADLDGSRPGGAC